jgi:hypothetical protein
VQHIGRVDVFETAEDLVEKVANVLIANGLRFEKLVQVGLHQTLHNVHVLHLVDVCRSDYVLNVDDLFVF